MAIFQPFIRSPLTDITGPMYNAQMSKCGVFEMKMMECLEAYGVKRGLEHPVCKDYASDFKECVANTNSLKRFEAMWVERQKQYYMEGKGPHYAPAPKMDSH